MRSPCKNCGSDRCMHLDPEKCRHDQSLRVKDHFIPDQDVTYQVKVLVLKNDRFTGLSCMYDGPGSMEDLSNQRYEVEMLCFYVEARIGKLEVGDSFTFRMDSRKGPLIERLVKT